MFRVTFRETLTTLAAIAISALTLQPLNAQNGHYVTGPTATLSGNELVVTWKEAGLGNNTLATYIASANATATYACINGGGNHPSAANKETITNPVSTTGTFQSGKNGAISGSLTVEPPSSGSFSCPPGQTMILASVSYNNITLTDSTFNDTASAVPSSVSACFVTDKQLVSELCPA